MRMEEFNRLVENRAERDRSEFVGCEYYFGDAKCSNCDGGVSDCNLGVQMNLAKSYKECGRRLITEHSGVVSEGLEIVGSLLI